MNIDVRAVSKRFKTFTALDSIDLRIQSGELVALLGPSGSGKTTLLRIIAGLDWPDSGEVRFDGQDALDLSVRDRNVGFVFQHYALFRHMSVYENVAFGLRVRPRSLRGSEEEIRERVQKLLDLVQIGWLADRFPGQLSGGQRQRVALARALAIEPRVLLLDEPFGALDAKVRKDLRRWLRNLHDELHVTSVFVTHDQEEALEVADRVVVMDRGHIEQIGSPEEVYERPASAFVHDFIGESIELKVQVENEGIRIGRHVLSLDAQGVPPGNARMFIRPHDLILREPGHATLEGRVTAMRRFGPTRRVDLELDVNGTPLPVEASVPVGVALTVGQPIGLALERYRLFKA